MDISPRTSLSSLLPLLCVPSKFARYDNITESSELDHLDEWKDNVHSVLTDIRAVFQANDSNISTEKQADIVSGIAVFDGVGPWITPASQQISQEILGCIEPSTTLLAQILNYHIRPLFQSNPHPFLNVTSGRKLAQSAGGPMASQDFYEGQKWKEYPGASNQLLWCVKHLKPEAYDNLWHLIIPPVMTLLDDYEARYKLVAVELVSQMLQHVPNVILNRTGVDGLLRASLATCLAFLDSPESPQLLGATVSTSLSLTTLTTLLGSTDRFNQLCALLGEGITGGVWLYASEKPDVILASIEALPPIITALGIGSARYLKALIPQLVYPLLPNPLNPSPVKLQISSLTVLQTVIEECAPCMARWKGTILDAVCRCWVTLTDSTSHEPISGLKIQLRQTCGKLAKACPSVERDEYQRFLSADSTLFGELFNHSQM